MWPNREPIDVCYRVGDLYEGLHRTAFDGIRTSPPLDDAGPVMYLPYQLQVELADATVLLGWRLRVSRATPRVCISRRPGFYWIGSTVTPRCRKHVTLRLVFEFVNSVVDFVYKS